MAADSTGFHSGRMMSSVPYTLNSGFMELVILAPLDSVSLMWQSFLMPFAARVEDIAALMKSLVGIFWKSSAWRG